MQDDNIWPLLLDAIIPIQSRRLLALPTPFLDKKMVKLLLDHGADPNRRLPYGNMTSWEYLLWEVQVGLRIDAWLVTVPLFLACGANPRAITNSHFRDRKSSSPKLGGGYQLRNALYDFLQSTNDKKSFRWGWHSSPRCEFSETDIETIKNSFERHVLAPGAFWKRGWGREGVQ